MMILAYLWLFSKISISGGVNSSDPFENWNGDSSCCNILEVTLKQEFEKNIFFSGGHCPLKSWVGSGLSVRVCMFSLCTHGFFSRQSGFLPRSKDMLDRLIDQSKIDHRC